MVFNLWYRRILPLKYTDLPIAERSISLEESYPFHQAYPSSITMTLFLIIEHFPPNPRPIYERFQSKGRLSPEGLTYINSWVTTDLTKCYQVMEAADRSMLDEWMANWD